MTTGIATSLLLGFGACWKSAAAQSTNAQPAAFGPSNPFYATSTLPFQAPPFDKIKDSDYQPAIDAGMAEQIKEVEAIANNPAPPTFENTFVAMERSGQLLRSRVGRVQPGDAGEYRPTSSQKMQDYEAPRTGRAAGRDLSERQTFCADQGDL